MVYPKAEVVGGFTVFNIKGNQYRLIVDIVYPDQTVFVKYILTHSEYDKDKWKNDLKGNTYRLIVGIDYEDGTIYYKYFLTHAEYDKDQ